jgi:hypothetical protein
MVFWVGPTNKSITVYHTMSCAINGGACNASRANPYEINRLLMRLLLEHSKISVLGNSIFEVP